MVRFTEYILLNQEFYMLLSFISGQQEDSVPGITVEDSSESLEDLMAKMKNI